MYRVVANIGTVALVMAVVSTSETSVNFSAKLSLLVIQGKWDKATSVYSFHIVLSVLFLFVLFFPFFKISFVPYVSIRYTRQEAFNLTAFCCDSCNQF
jgi:hypothetical protein